MLRVGVICFLATYVIAMMLEVARLPWRNVGLRWLAWGTTAAGFTAHTMYLLVRTQQTHLPPLLSSAHDWLVVLAWLAVLIQLFFTTLDGEVAAGLFILPVVVALCSAAPFVSMNPGQVLNAARGWTMLHVSFLVFGTAGIIAAFILSMMYLWQHRRLKHHQSFLSGVTLPSLERLERWNRWAIILSIPMLTVGLGTGIGLSVVRSGTRVAWTDPLVWGSSFAWILMTSLFAWLVRTRNPGGRRVAWLTLWAGGFLMISVVGLQVVAAAIRLPTVHGSGESVQHPPQNF